VAKIWDEKVVKGLLKKRGKGKKPDRRFRKKGLPQIRLIGKKKKGGKTLIRQVYSKKGRKEGKTRKRRGREGVV